VDAWANFGVAVTGATAALIGLLVVALSINLRQIVGSEHLPTRALLALLLLVMPLVAGILLLVPQTTTAFGVELVVLGVVVGIWLGVLARPAGRPPEQSIVIWFADSVLPAATVTVATLATGVLLIAGHPAGFYGLPVVVLAGYGGALIGAWVLLVEILR
jgi:modulator of FtsH protease